MTGIFKYSNPTSVFLLLLYAIFLKIPLFIHPLTPIAYDSIFYTFILNFIAPIAKGFPFIYSVLTFILLFIQAIYFNKIVNTLHLHKQANYLTAMSYLLITSLLSDWFSFSAALIVNTFSIWIWSKLCLLYNNPNPKATIFNIGFITGLASFIYFPFIGFLVLVMIGIAIARPFRIQEWLTGLVGIITPVYLFTALIFLSGSLSKYHFPKLSFHLPHVLPNKWAIASVIMLLIMICIGLYYTVNNMRRQVVFTRKSWQLLFLFCLVAFLSTFIDASTHFSKGIIVALPIAAIIGSAFFYPQKKMVPILLHWMMIGLYVAGYFFK